MDLRPYFVSAIMATTALCPVAARAGDPPTASQRFAEFTSEAEKAYDAKEYQAAIDAYLEAYTVVPSADVLYNIAFIYESNLARPQLARDFYGRVIRDPLAPPDLTRMATERVAAIDGAAAAADARARVLEPSGSTSGGGVSTRMASPKSSPSLVPWFFIGAGGAAILTGVVMGTVASSSHDAFARETDLSKARTHADSGKTQAIAADVLWIGGGALVLTGVILAVTASGDDDEASLRFSPAVGSSGAGFAMGGRW